MAALPRVPLPAGHPARIQTIPSCMHSAMRLLLDAYDQAHELANDVWACAVEIDCLRRAGLTNNDLRWLVRRNYIEHAVEITRPGKKQRQFRKDSKLSIAERTHVVLTTAGATIVRIDNSQRLPPPKGDRQFAERNGQRSTARLVPEWDSARRELRVGGHIVKQFKQPAPSQETILASFEEEGWPDRMDDPLPPQFGVCEKQRLHQTIVNLNRYQKAGLIRFFGDGTGDGVCWQVES